MCDLMRVLRSGLERRVPELDVDALAILVPIRDGAELVQVHPQAAGLEREELTRLPGRVIPHVASTGGADASHPSAFGRSAGLPSGVTTSACLAVAPGASSQARPVSIRATRSLISLTSS